MIALLLVACGSEPAEVPAVEPVELRVFLDGAPRTGGGTVVVQAEYDPAGNLELPEPVSTDGKLSFTADGPPVEELIGARRVVTQRYLFRGPNGSYEIPPLTARWDGKDADAEGKSTALFVDLGVKPPAQDGLVDIVEPEPLVSLPWLAIGAVVALFAAGLGFAFRPRRAPVVAAEPPPPPDQLALAAWDRVRRDPQLTVDDKAQQIARIFREYVEAVLGYEATSRTTFELLAHLEALQHLPEGNVPRARRVLRAADRVKFAEERPGVDGKTAVAMWLEELDADLRGFVDSTRPSAWTGSPR